MDFLAKEKRLYRILFNRVGFLATHTLLVLFFCASLSVSAEEKPKIKITGGSESLRENVRNFLPLNDEDCKTPPWRLRALLREAESKIMNASRALGYYKLVSTHELNRTEKCWSLVINLEPGEPVLISEIRIQISGEGSDHRVFTEIRDNPGFEVKSRLNHGKYESLKNRFSVQASAHGYFDGKFEHARVAVNLEENTAAVELAYNTGPRYKFGKIDLQQEVLNDSFVKRYIEFKEGDYYESEKLLHLKNMLNMSNYFSIANITPELNHLSDEQVPITITLEPRKRYGYSVGVGVATDTGPRLLLGFEDRYISSKGHSLTADLNASEVKTTFETAYTIPMKRPAYEYMKTYYGYIRENTEVSLSQLHKVGVSYTRFDTKDWLITYAVNYELEDSVVGSEDENRTALLIPSVSVARTKAHGSPNYPTKGWNLAARLSGSPETLGSDFSFVQFNSRAKYIHSLGGGRLLLRAELGATQVNNFEDLPASVRFFAGGDSSVRGYDYKSLGPTTRIETEEEVDGVLVPVVKDEVTGGNNLFVTSIEYDYLIKPKWAVAAFFDQGNAADDFDFEFKRGAGLGVRWISPIGPVRIDVAKALDDDKGWALHLSMGPDL